VNRQIGLDSWALTVCKGSDLGQCAPVRCLFCLREAMRLPPRGSLERLIENVVRPARGVELPAAFSLMELM